MKKIVLTLIILSQFGKAQNYVPNHNFEYFIPEDCIFGNSFINIAKPWESVEYLNDINSPSEIGYLNECSNANYLGFIYAGVPLNTYGYAYAQSGNGYITMKVSKEYNISDYYRGYVTTQMIKKLEKDKTYCVSFYYLFPSKNRYSIQNIGISFSESRYFYNLFTEPYLQVSPSISNNFLATDTLTWNYFSGTYTANGGESYLTIGNFDPIDQCVTQIINPNYQDNLIRVFIDNVCVSDVNECICDVEHEWPKIPINVNNIPNVVTPNNDALNDYLKVENLSNEAIVRIYNRWGILVYENNLNQKPWPEQDIVAGTYWLIINNEEQIIKKFITVIK